MKSKVLSLSLALALAAASALLPSTGPVAEEADGRVLFTDTHRCNACHSVPSAGIKAETESEEPSGPELKYMKVRPADLTRITLRFEESKSHESFEGTEEELQTLIDWLGSLEAQE